MKNILLCLLNCLYCFLVGRTLIYIDYQDIVRAVFINGLMITSSLVISEIERSYIEHLI